MLTEFRLENFKCFGTETVVPCGRLTLLTGINGKGKSTTLQALLMLHQSVDRALAGARRLLRVEINGWYVRLGSFREIQNRDRPKSEPVRIALEFKSPVDVTTITRLWLKQENDDARWADISQLEIEKFQGDARTSSEIWKRDKDSLEQLPEISLGLEALGRVHYVGADRLGPQDFFPWSSEAGFSSVGVRGEKTAEVLSQAENEHQQVTDLRAHINSETSLVTDLTSAWLSHIFDGGAMRVSSPYSTILTLEMNSDGSAHYHRPVNLGFGYSYVLPILVAGLVSQPGDILVVENPEAHLHPLAQSRMGEFLAKVSAAGVQVFVESHSEHILNAFRLAVKERVLSAEELSVLYFRRDASEPVLLVPVKADGRIAFWPDGFFDQRTHDFLRLFGEGQ